MRARSSKMSKDSRFFILETPDEYASRLVTPLAGMISGKIGVMGELPLHSLSLSLYAFLPCLVCGHARGQRYMKTWFARQPVPAWLGERTCHSRGLDFGMTCLHHVESHVFFATLSFRRE